ncbi:MAG TPA: hypothetical protein PLJ21_12240 [Pseudobdellovibrionaceae bacterium]|nr:hypothetical protein [Pseudobdellovibrionaceae bacterium]
MPQLLKYVKNYQRTSVVLVVLILIFLGTALEFATKDFMKRTDVMLQKKDKITACKNLKSLSIVISAEEGIPDLNEQTVQLNAEFKLLSFSVKDFKYRWELPAGVEVVSGDLEGRFENVNISELSHATLRVRGFSKEELKQISLTARLQKEGKDLQGASAILSSDSSKTWEHYGLEMSQLRSE